MDSAVVGLGETPRKENFRREQSDDDSRSAERAGNRKREQYVEWRDYFMAVALLSAQRSKDPSTQVGACIVNSEKRIVGIGYNGMPTGCDDDELPWGKTAENKLDTKYPYVCHAEMNAIMNKNSSDLKGCSIFVALFPCNECAKLIIQARISLVVYLNDKPDKPEMIASKRLLDMAGIKYEKYIPSISEIRISLKTGHCQLLQSELDGEMKKLEL